MSGLGGWLGGMFSSNKNPPKEAVIAPLTEYTPFVKTRDEAVARYGEIKDGAWPEEAQWMVYVPVPSVLQSLWLVDGKERLTRIRCNRDAAPPLQHAMDNIITRGYAKELKSFDGCFNIRNTRGSSSLSAHAYGLAIDLNCDTNPLGGPSSLSSGFVKCWTDCGFTWGGNFHGRIDPMHFSFCGW